jgi:hypothetical protein
MKKMDKECCMKLLIPSKVSSCSSPDDSLSAFSADDVYTVTEKERIRLLFGH